MKKIILTALIMLTGIAQAQASIVSLFFEFDSYQLTSESKARLSEALQNNSIETISIYSYADPIGTHKYNKRLSQSRAQSAKNFITSNGAISAHLFNIVNNGEDNSNIINAKKRRVDLLINDNNDSYRRQLTSHLNSINRFTKAPARTIASLASRAPANTYDQSTDIVNANHNIYFNVNKDRPTRSEGDKIIQALNNYNGGEVRLYGYADPSGSIEYNLALSKRRSINVKKILIRLRNIPPENITLYYLGEDGTTGRDYRNKRRVSAYWGNAQENLAGTLIDDSNIAYARPAIVQPSAPVVIPEPPVVAPTPEPLPTVVEVIPEPVAEALPEPVIETASVEPEKEIVIDEHDRDFWVAPFIGAQNSSAHYEDDLPFEHGKTTFLNYGARAGYAINKKWDIEAYAYYLPTEVDEATSVVNFANAQSIDYENNLYGINISRQLDITKNSRFGARVGYSSHIIGSIEGLGSNTFGFDKFNHQGINLGLYYKHAIAKRWMLDVEALYILPLGVGDVSESSPGLWYQAGIGLMRWHGDKKKWQYGLDYRAYYHQSELTFDSLKETDAEYFIQTLMLGIKRHF